MCLFTLLFFEGTSARTVAALSATASGFQAAALFQKHSVVWFSLGFRLHMFLAIGLKQGKLELSDPKTTNSKNGDETPNPTPERPQSTDLE